MLDIQPSAHPKDQGSEISERGIKWNSERIVANWVCGAQSLTLTFQSKLSPSIVAHCTLGSAEGSGTDFCFEKKLES